MSAHWHILQPGRRAAIVLVVLVVILVGLTGCRFEGVSALPLPGAVGVGPGAYAVQVELADVGTLKPNAQVKVGEVAVGTVTGLSTRNWHAVATVSLGEDVRLPANAVAAVGQNSLLGASYLEMSGPQDEAPVGTLVAGTVIPLARTKAYPSTEQVLAATSVVLNGSGLNQLSTITRELDRALGGDDGALGRLLPQLDELVTGLDDQRADITTALDGLDRLSGSLAGQTDTISTALEKLGPALDILAEDKDQIVGALESLRRLGEVGSHVVRESGDDLTSDLRDLQPVLKSLADTKEHLVGSLGLLVTFPFPAFTAPKACRGDYCNLSLTVDLQLSKLDTGLLDGTPLAGLLFGVQNLLGGTAPGTAGQATDPLLAPLLPGVSSRQPAAASAPPASSATPAPAPSTPQGTDQKRSTEDGSGGPLESLFGGGA